MTILEGKKVLLTGSTGSIGKEIAKMLKFSTQYDMIVGARISNKSGAFHRNLAKQFYNYKNKEIIDHSIEKSFKSYPFKSKDTTCT